MINGLVATRQRSAYLESHRRVAGFEIVSLPCIGFSALRLAFCEPARNNASRCAPVRTLFAVLIVRIGPRRQSAVGKSRPVLKGLSFELSDSAHLDRGLRFMLDKTSKRPLVRNRTLPLMAACR